MKKIFLLAISAFVSLYTTSQVVDVHYLNPQNINEGLYRYIRFGTTKNYQAGFMFNETSADFGDGNDFSIFTYNNYDLTIRTGTGNFIVFPQSGGKVGIGTTFPNEKLDVRGTTQIIPSSRSNTLKLDRSSGKATIKAIKNSSDGNMVIDPATDGDAVYISHYVNSNTYLSSGGGRVGIGTTSPAAKLQIINKAEDSNGYTLILGPITSANLRLGYNKDYSWIQSHGAKPLRINELGNNTILNLNKGSVGIGTESPGSDKLAVNGSIRAKEIKVEATGWSDFVFEDYYDLPTLNELENFISENKHLPEIPNQSEVTKSGINLGEMNAKLLQKVEELTLYLIEQNKQNQAQQNEIDELKAMNEVLLKKIEGLE
jgi:hypothetical protein